MAGNNQFKPILDNGKYFIISNNLWVIKACGIKSENKLENK